MQTEEKYLYDEYYFRHYLNNLQLREEQLRFPSSTSRRGSYGVILIVHDKKFGESWICLVPYRLKQAHSKTEPMFDYKEGEDGFKITLQRCLKKETGLDLKELPTKIGQKTVPNSDEEAIMDDFVKFVMVTNKFKGSLHTKEQIVSKKNGVPVWVNLSFLSMVFEEKVEVEGKLKSHPQLYAYQMFKEYLESVR